MTSGGIEVNHFALIRVILEANFGDDPLLAYKFYLTFFTQI